MINKNINNGNILTKFYTLDRSVCCVFIDNGTVVARGVAVCSPLDKFDYKKGKKMALHRARAAIELSSSNSSIVPRKLHTISKGKIIGYGSHLSKLLKQGITEKITFCPINITRQEKEILKRLS